MDRQSAPALKTLLGKREVQLIRDCMRSVSPRLDADYFYDHAIDALDTLALKARVTHVIGVLHQVLPPIERALVIIAAMGAHWRDACDERQVNVFGAWPIIDYVGVHGLDAPNESLEVLKDLTDLHTSEFAIRPFVQMDQDRVFKKIHTWLAHENEHVRRLCSEGVRPRLPWGAHITRLKENPKPIFKVLKCLMCDPSRYVQKSVANNLNDIAKDHPDQVIKFCGPYMSAKQVDPVSQWIVTRGLRTLVKQGYRPALDLLGFDLDSNVIAQGRLAKIRIQVGQALEFEVQLKNKGSQAQRWVVDYQIGYVTANGKRSYKTFKLKNVSIEAGGVCTLTKSHAFKPLSTRRHYPGDHEVVILVNGEAVLTLAFKLRF